MRIATKEDFKYIEAFVSKDYARNYFIAQGLKKGLETYKTIYIGDNAMLFHRQSGNLQYISYGGDNTSFRELIETLEFGLLIGSKAMCHDLGLSVYKEGAFISRLDREDFSYEESPAVKIQLDDLEEIEALYKTLFPGYVKAAYMKEKLESGRGSGYMIKEDKILSVAQSDFNELIVGVATHKSHQRKGYAKACMMALMKEMFESNSSVYLQYDSSDAGKLYDQLGFKTIDQVIHYKR